MAHELERDVELLLFGKAPSPPREYRRMQQLFRTSDRASRKGTEYITSRYKGEVQGLELEFGMGCEGSGLRLGLVRLIFSLSIVGM